MPVISLTDISIKHLKTENNTRITYFDNNSRVSEAVIRAYIQDQEKEDARLDQLDLLR